jgi:hypothetical protein
VPEVAMADTELRMKDKIVLCSKRTHESIPYLLVTRVEELFQIEVEYL